MVKVMAKYADGTETFGARLRKFDGEFRRDLVVPLAHPPSLPVDQVKMGVALGQLRDATCGSGEATQSCEPGFWQ
ncbi:MAG: hypothetical protein ACRCUE_21430, partial [Bosea sp. (in: a-proteobacteria)]